MSHEIFTLDFEQLFAGGATAPMAKMTFKAEPRTVMRRCPMTGEMVEETIWISNVVAAERCSE